MDMSKAAMAPIQPAINEADRKHPQFAEYMSYRSAMSRLMVEAQSFQDWLHSWEVEKQNKMLTNHPMYQDFKQWMIDNKGGEKGRTKKIWPENFYAWINGERW